MSQYQSPRDPFGGSYPADDPSEAISPRVSGLAVASIVAGVLCCVPGVGAVGVVLAIAALISVSRSEGRLGGRTLAFIALVLGVLGTMAWVGIALGVRQAYIIYDGELMGPTVEAAQYGEKDDWALYRGLLTPDANGRVSDADLEAFRAAYRTQFGPLVGPVGGSSSAGRAGPRPGGQGSKDAIDIPIPAEFQSGMAFFVIRFPAQVFYDVFLSGQDLKRKVDNIGVFTKDGMIWLVPDAPKPTP